MSTDWISVKDKLPDEYLEVMYVVVNERGNRQIMIGHRENNKWVHCCLFYSPFTLDDKHCTVTHWMTLPSFPQEE